MKRLIAPLALLWFAPLAALAQTPSAAVTAPAATAHAVTTPAAPALPKPATVRVILQTADGPIAVEVEVERAPVTAANFLRYVDQKRLDGASFYRAVKVGDGYGLVQGGTRNDPKKTLKPIAHEPTNKTKLSHLDGALSMARGDPGTAGGDFFIVVGDLPSMDADPQAPGDNAGYAVFGKVVEGMDVVRRILLSPTSPTAGEGAMKGQMLAPVVKIVSARRAG